MEGLPPVSPDAVSLNLGDHTAGSISFGAELDLYTYAGQAGDVIQSLIAERTTFSGGSSNAPWVHIYAPSLTEISSYKANAQHRDTLSEAGTYVLVVRSSDLAGEGGYLAGEGGYGLNLAGLQPVTPSAAVISCNTTVSSSVSAAGEVDLITFAGQAGQVVILTISEASTFTGGSSNTPQLTVFSPALDQLALFNANNQQQITLPTTGTYIFRVTANDLAATGNYGLNLVCL